MTTNPVVDFLFCGGPVNTGEINDVTFIIYGRSPQEVFDDLKSAVKLSEVVLEGKGVSSDVTTKNPFNASAVRCFLCSGDVRFCGRVVGSWETIDERPGKWMKTVASLVLHADAAAGKKTCRDSPTIRCVATPQALQEA